MSLSELERRLVEWGEEYGGSRYANVGWASSSPIATLMRYHGRAPQGLNPRPVIGTPADQVEDAVRSMLHQRDGQARIAVLRCEYWMRHAAMDHKLDRLRHKDKLRMSPRTYYNHLKVARAYLAGWLRLPTFDAKRSA